MATSERESEVSESCKTCTDLVHGIVSVRVETVREIMRYHAGLLLYLIDVMQDGAYSSAKLNVGGN